MGGQNVGMDAQATDSRQQSRLVDPVDGLPTKWPRWAARCSGQIDRDGRHPAGGVDLLAEKVAAHERDQDVELTPSITLSVAATA